MKEQVLQALKTKYPTNLGFSQKTLEMVATYLAANITEESQIEAAVGGVEPVLKTFQSEADARVTTALSKAKEPQKQPTTPEIVQPAQPTMQPQQSTDEPPAWFKAFSDSVTAKITAIETQKATENRQKQLEAALGNCPTTLKNMILKDFSRMNFNDEEFQAYLTEKQTEVSEFNQAESNAALSNTPKPFVGKKTQDGISTETAEYIASVTAAANGKGEFSGKPIFETLN